MDANFFLLNHANEIYFTTVHQQIFFIFYKYPEIKKKKVYSHAYLTICFIELACYGSRDNVFEQITWIWNWRCRLNLRYMILTSAALNPLSCFCFPFRIFISSVLSPSPVIMGCICYLCVELGTLFAWLFYSFQATNSLFYVTQGKTSDRCLFCFSG